MPGAPPKLVFLGWVVRNKARMCGELSLIPRPGAECFRVASVSWTLTWAEIAFNTIYSLRLPNAAG